MSLKLISPKEEDPLKINNMAKSKVTKIRLNKDQYNKLNKQVIIDRFKTATESNYVRGLHLKDMRLVLSIYKELYGERIKPKCSECLKMAMLKLAELFYDYTRYLIVKEYADPIEVFVNDNNDYNESASIIISEDDIVRCNELKEIRDNSIENDTSFNEYIVTCEVVKEE